jgi:hypothetical protein
VKTHRSIMWIGGAELSSYTFSFPRRSKRLVMKCVLPRWSQMRASTTLMSATLVIRPRRNFAGAGRALALS